MSINYEDFLAWLKSQLAELSLVQKAHTIQRVYEKIRLVHNAVGDVYKHRQTIVEFKLAYPVVYEKLKVEIAPFVDGDYITEDGWKYFLQNMFDPRHNAIMNVLLEIRKTLRNTLASTEVEGF